MANSRRNNDPQVVYIVAPGAKIVANREMPSESPDEVALGPLGEGCETPPLPPDKGPGYAQDTKKKKKPATKGFFLDRYVY